MKKIKINEDDLFDLMYLVDYGINNKINELEFELKKFEDLVNDINKQLYSLGGYHKKDED